MIHPKSNVNGLKFQIIMSFYFYFFWVGSKWIFSTWIINMDVLSSAYFKKNVHLLKKLKFYYPKFLLPTPFPMCPCIQYWYAFILPSQTPHFILLLLSFFISKKLALTNTILHRIIFYFSLHFLACFVRHIENIKLISNIYQANLLFLCFDHVTAVYISVCMLFIYFEIDWKKINDY